MNPQDPTIFHCHDFMELVCIESGQGVHFTKNESYPIAAGDVFVIRKHDAHGYSNTNNLRLINVLFYPDQLALPLKELDGLSGYHAMFGPRRPSGSGLKSHLRLDLKQLAHVESLISSLERVLEEKEKGFSFMAKALFMQIIHVLSCYYEGRQTRIRPLLEKISGAIAHIEQNYANPIRPADLAGLVYMSQRNLYRHFRSATGLSPLEYLIRLRVMRGAELLRQGRTNVTEAAFQTGFNDSNYFSRTFCAVMGVSPRTFIKMQD